jgi:hypothetical protein
MAITASLDQPLSVNPSRPEVRASVYPAIAAAANRIPQRGRGRGEPLVAQREGQRLGDQQPGDRVQREGATDVDPREPVDADAAISTPEVQVEVHVAGGQDGGRADDEETPPGVHHFTTRVPVM